MTIPVKANALREKAKQKIKEVGVIDQDIEAAGGKEYVNVLLCVWYMYYDMTCYYIGIYLGTLSGRVL